VNQCIFHQFETHNHDLQVNTKTEYYGIKNNIQSERQAFL
jgi:hypothetical protein